MPEFESPYDLYVVITCTVYMADGSCQRRKVWCKICLCTRVLTAYRSISLILYYNSGSNKMPVAFSYSVVVTP